MGDVQVSLQGRGLVVAMPVHAQVCGETMISLVATVQLLAKHGVRVSLACVLHQSVVSKARDILHARALQVDPSADAVLWLDADMIWRAEDVLRTFARIVADDQADVVAAVGRKKCRDLRHDYAGAPMTKTGEDGRAYIEAKDGLWRAHRFGYAWVMQARHVMERLTEDAISQGKTYRVNDGEDVQHIYGMELAGELLWTEDYTVCKRMRKLGVQMWIDPSIWLGHVGMYVWEGRFGEYLQVSKDDTQ